jgi:alpha-amylase
MKISTIILLFTFLIASCTSGNQSEVNVINDNYRNYYQIFVRSFNDSNGDRIGDLQGIIEKIPYLKSMSVTGLWLMPLNESPTYHKYDVIDYFKIDPEYGTMEDLKELIKIAKENDIKIIIDLVINHTSSKHPWFLQAKEAIINNDLDNKYIDYYNFSKTSGRNYHFLVGSRDTYFEGHFWSEMPDLNMDNEEVRDEVKKIVEFYLDIGISGFRLDAVPHVYTGVSKNIEFWNWFNDYVKSINPEAYLVGEVWSTHSTILEYSKTNLDSLFYFPFAEVSGTISNAVNRKEGSFIVNRYQTVVEEIKNVNSNAIMANFISNHDNNRSVGYFGRDENKIKMGASLLLMLPGNPFVYYGEEIGMTGSGNDPTKRLPMIWSDSIEMSIPPGASVVQQPFESVEKQIRDKDSILNHYKKAMSLRLKYPEIARGEIVPIQGFDNSIAAYYIKHEGSELIIIHNLSDQESRLDLGSTLNYEFKILEFLNKNSRKINSDIIIPGYSSVIIK